MPAPARPRVATHIRLEQDNRSDYITNFFNSPRFAGRHPWIPPKKHIDRHTETDKESVGLDSSPNLREHIHDTQLRDLQQLLNQIKQTPTTYPASKHGGHHRRANATTNQPRQNQRRTNASHHHASEQTLTSHQRRENADHHCRCRPQPPPPPPPPPPPTPHNWGQIKNKKQQQQQGQVGPTKPSPREGQTPGKGSRKKTREHRQRRRKPRRGRKGKRKRRRRRQRKKQKKKTRSAKRNTNHKQKPQRTIGQMATAATKRKRKQKPQSAKRQTPTQPPNGPREEDEHPRRAEAPERQRTATNHNHRKKKNTPACRRPWASKDKHQQQWPATKDQCQPQPPRGRETQQKGQDHINCKTNGTPGGAEAPNRCGQKPESTKRKNSAQKAKSSQQLTVNGALSLLHRRGRGDEGCSSGTNP